MSKMWIHGQSGRKLLQVSGEIIFMALVLGTIYFMSMDILRGTYE